MLLAVIPLVIIGFGLMMLFASWALGEEHQVMKIALFLLSPVTIWSALHFAALGVAKIYGYTEIIELIGTTTYWMGWVFFVLISYFFIYFIKKAFDAARMKKEADLRY